MDEDKNNEEHDEMKLDFFKICKSMGESRSAQIVGAILLVAAILFIAFYKG